MTRDDAEDHAPVGARAKNAKHAGCNTFISLHLNDFDDDSANGVEVLYSNAGSKAYAQSLQTALVSVTQFKDRKIRKRDDLAVLKFNGLVVLIELGFIAHDGNRVVVLNPQARAAICAQIAAVTLNASPS
jgi:N-acetylmuramoyl-L-alanine amidase